MGQYIMRRTEIAGFRAESYETLQGMARKTACSECEIKGFAVVQDELIIGGVLDIILKHSRPGRGIRLSKRPRMAD